MTMPSRQNCGHSEDGWCIPCVMRLDDERRALEDGNIKNQQLRVGVRTLYFDLLKIIAEDGAPVNHPFRAVTERLAIVIDSTAPETT